jgi:hypothetical protein
VWSEALNNLLVNGMLISGIGNALKSAPFSLQKPAQGRLEGKVNSYIP